MPVAWMPLLALLSAAARAYETDQLTDRDRPLRDLAPEANARADVLLAEAIAATNRRLDCRAGMERTRQVLAREIYRRTGTFAVVPERGLVRMFGFGRYEAWLERSGLEQRDFHERTDIFGELSFWESVILHLIGPCSTVRIAGVDQGTDKVEHFFSVGWNYYRRSRWGLDERAALAWGTATERTYLGTLTSRVFSFADLRANYDGYRFYAGLLEPGSIAVLDPAGCVVQTRPWDWSEWMTWEYDEVLNPSVYAPIVQDGVARTLEARAEAVCAAWRRWGEGYAAHLDRVLAAWPPYVVGPAPARSDPYQLERLCSGDPIWR